MKGKTIVKKNNFDQLWKRKKKMKSLELENSKLKETNNKEIESTNLKTSKAYSENAKMKSDTIRLIVEDVRLKNSNKLLTKKLATTDSFSEKRNEQIKKYQKKLRIMFVPSDQ